MQFTTVKSVNITNPYTQNGCSN